jgi:hypothetical protein
LEKSLGGGESCYLEERGRRIPKLETDGYRFCFGKTRHCTSAQGAPEMKVAATEVGGARIPAWFAPPVLFLTLALTIASTFWIIPMLTAPDKSPDSLVLFREGGDPGYLPMVAWEASLKFGENSVKEFAGTGVRAFPFVPFTIHAIFYRIAGSTGFMLADLFTVVLYACLLRQFLLVAEVARWPAELLSLAAISGTTLWFRNKANAIFHHSMPVLFWGFRFPRPSVTQSVFVLLLILGTMLMTRKQRPVWLFAMFGVTFAATLQSDIYAAFNGAFVVGAVLVFAMVAGQDRWAAAKRVLAAVAATGLASVPFFYQQLHTSADVKRRFGVYPSQRYWAVLLDRNITAFIFICLVAAAVFWKLYRSRAQKRGRLAALAVVATVTATSALCGPVSLALMHQTIQPYHFWFQAMLTIGYALLVYAGWLLTDFRGISPLGRLSEKRWSVLTATAGVVFTGFCFYIACRTSMHLNRGDLPTYNPLVDDFHLVHYRTDFGELHSVLSQPEYADAKVMATFDIQLGVWWLYKEKYLYLVEPFQSTLPDSVMEARAFQFLRLMGTSNEEFGQLLDDPYFLYQVLGSDKYQADSAYTAWPLSDYSPEAQRRIASTSWSHHLELPLSEKARLMKAYEQTSKTHQYSDALDIIVMDKEILRGYVHPERGNRFRLAMSNRTFELWVPNKPGIAGLTADARQANSGQM